MLDIVSESIINEIRHEEGKRNSLPNVKLSEMELDVLSGLSEGRSVKEITAGLKLYNKYYTFYSVTNIILNKLEAFTLPHVISKAIKMGLI